MSSECHGENAEGTEIAPALYGHTRADVYRQLRVPIGIMTPFSPDQIGIRDAEYLVAYIENLPMPEQMDMNGGHMHMHGTFRLNHVVEYHHWYALDALQTGNTGEAIHHVSHIIEFTEGSHQIAMQTILEQLLNGELDTAQLELENMLFGILPPETPQSEDYIRIALVMVQIEKPFHAVHYLEHSGEMMSLDSPMQEQLDNIIALIESEDFATAQEQLQVLIATFTPINTDGMNMGDDDMSGMDMGDDSMGGMDMGNGLTSIDDLVIAMENAGATVSLAETLDQPFFTVSAQVLLVNEIQALQVYEYADEMGAMADADLVDPSGSPIGTVQAAWMMPPHFYRSGNLVVIYIGADADTLSLLADVLGEQFAGSGQ